MSDRIYQLGNFPGAALERESFSASLADTNQSASIRAFNLEIGRYLLCTERFVPSFSARPYCQERKLDVGDLRHRRSDQATLISATSQ